MTKRQIGPFAQTVSRLTYDEKRFVWESCCDACKGGPYAMDSDCPDWCDEFSKQAQEMIELMEITDESAS